MKILSLILFVLLYWNNSFSQIDTNYRTLLDVCRIDRIETPFTDIDIYPKCYNELGELSYQLDSISLCNCELQYSTAGYMNDSNSLGQEIIHEHKIWTIERIDQKRWVKTDFDFNGDQVGKYFIEQVGPEAISYMDTTYTENLLTGEIIEVNITTYLECEWKK